MLEGGESAWRQNEIKVNTKDEMTYFVQGFFSHQLDSSFCSVLHLDATHHRSQIMKVIQCNELHVTYHTIKVYFNHFAGGVIAVTLLYFAFEWL